MKYLSKRQISFKSRDVEVGTTRLVLQYTNSQVGKIEIEDVHKALGVFHVPRNLVPPVLDMEEGDLPEECSKGDNL